MARSSPSALVVGLFDRLFDIKPREFVRTQAFFLFLTTTSIFYTMGAAVGDTLFLSRFGSQGAERLLPWVYIGIGLLTVALTWLYDQVAERLPREKFVVGVNLVLATSILAFRWLIRGQHLWPYYALVIWLEACALMALMLFFSFAGDYFTTRDARRLYGYINGGVAVGSVVGGYAVDRLVRVLGDDNLLYVCSGLLACGALWCLVIPALARPIAGAGSGEDEQESSVPLRAVLSQRFLQIVIALVLISQACCWLIDYQLKIVASRQLHEEALAIFFGKFYGALGVVQLGVQFALVGWLLRRFGVIRSLTILPILLCVSSGFFYLHPVFMAAVAGNFIRLALLETLDEPAQELLFLPLTARVRLRAQSFVEGMVLPLGICLAGGLLLVFSGLFRDASQISIAAIVLGLAWIGAIVALMPRYRDTLSSSLRQLGLEAPNLPGVLDSAEGVRAVQDLLADQSPDRQLLALDLWKDRSLGPLADPVRRLAGSGSAAVAVKALEALAADGDKAHAAAIQRALEDSRGEVRAAAVSAAFRADSSLVTPNLPRWSRDEDASVRVALLTGCLSLGDAAADDALHRLGALLRSQDVSERVTAAKALARASRPGTAQLLRQLLNDPALQVRREIVAASLALPQAELAPWLIEQLKELELRPLATAALEGMPLSAVPVFIEALAERERAIEERALLVRILGRFGGLRGAKVLWEILGSEEDVILRVACAQTLVFMQARAKNHDLSRYEDDRFLLRRLDELAAITDARAEVGVADPLYGQVLFDHARLEARTILFTLALSSEDHRVEHVEASLFDGTETQKANALEIIEMTFSRQDAAKVSAVLGALVMEQHAGDGALAPATIRSLMQMSPWVRAATRHHLAARGVQVGEGEELAGHEVYMYKLMSRISFLKQARLFEGVTANYLMSLARIAEEQTFCKDEVLFSEGQKADSCYLVCQGAVRVVVGGRTVARLGPRDCAGEMAVIESQPYSATVMADDDVRALRISTNEFNSVLHTHPEITVALLRYMSARLRQSLAGAIA